MTLIKIGTRRKTMSLKIKKVENMPIDEPTDHKNLASN